MIKQWTQNGFGDVVMESADENGIDLVVNVGDRGEADIAIQAITPKLYILKVFNPDAYDPSGDIEDAYEVTRFDSRLELAAYIYGWDKGEFLAHITDELMNLI